MGRQQILATCRQHRQLLPLLLLAAYCINAIVAAVNGTVVMAGDMYNFELTTKHYAAFGAIGLNFVTYWFFPPYYKYTLGLTIAGGLFNLMTFPALETTQSFALSSLKVSFQSAAFLAGLVAYIINFKRANQFVIDNLTNKPTPEEQDKIEKAGFQESVGKFKEKYSSYSEEILTEIVIEKKFVPEALEAARQLLKERQHNENSI
ncbi:hypothetical protein ACN9ML_17430 [Dyadobacter endophyticus]|uniref:hypothetical protein n=1 Tax=Dyadobacter endophyticus TaxID=1749036 RepID=UPI003CF088A3